MAMLVAREGIAKLGLALFVPQDRKIDIAQQHITLAVGHGEVIAAAGHARLAVARVPDPGTRLILAQGRPALIARDFGVVTVSQQHREVVLPETSQDQAW